MPDHPLTPSTPAPEIILHGRRLRLSETQARLLELLLSQQGHVVADAELHAVLPHDRLLPCMSRIRPVIKPYGLVIYRVVGAGYLLAQEEEGCGTITIW